MESCNVVVVVVVGVVMVIVVEGTPPHPDAGPPPDRGFHLHPNVGFTTHNQHHVSHDVRCCQWEGDTRTEEFPFLTL